VGLSFRNLPISDILDFSAIRLFFRLLRWLRKTFPVVRSVSITTGKQVVVRKFVYGLRLAALILFLVLEHEIQDAKGVDFLKFVVPMLVHTVPFCHLADGERRIIYAPVFEKLLKDVLHLHDELCAALGGAIDIED